MASDRLVKFKQNQTKVSLKTYSNKLYTGVIVHVDNYYVELNTHNNVVERFELGEVLFIDEGCRE
jgi:small nuclear ribonucleoprotein (snRNP)-like protein